MAKLVLPHALGKAAATYVLLALRVCDAHDQHVLGEPSLVASHLRGDAQREALLAEQGVAAVATAVAPDRALLGEVHDVLDVGVARPRHVLVAGGERCADGVHARHERPVRAEHLDGVATHPGHDLHVHGDVGRVGDLHAELGDLRAERTHAERDHVHRPAGHAAVEQPVQDPLHLRRVHPVVRRAGVIPGLGADERAVLDPRDVARIGAGEEAVRSPLLVQLGEGARLHQQGAEPIELLVGSIAPVDVGGFAQLDHLGDPAPHTLVLHVLRGFHARHRCAVRDARPRKRHPF